MIVKKRTVPLKIQVCEALLRRLPNNYVSRHELQEELDRRWAGYRGEESLDYQLGFLDEKKYLIFHDLNLPMGENTFQIDTLLLSANLAIIIEVKNISGILFFDQEFHQLIRTNKNGEQEGFPDPVTQASLHALQLKRFLQEHRLPQVPIEFAVVITSKNSILKTTAGHRRIFEKVFKAPHLPNRIQHLEAIYQKEILSFKDMNKISRNLLKNNTPPRKLFMDRYLSSKNQLKPGVHCPACSYIPIKRVKRQWYCPSCKIYLKDAHFDTLRDYFLLVDSKINNQQFRDFSLVQSRDVASRLLASTNFGIEGTTKGRQYLAPAELYMLCRDGQ
ncbi:nuclease-related domain-containing protein [Bacillus sp. T33-2]|uniref:nuclease-related domain-containing protein n=1 Tax=Bacillus sp. T33-2 TaxID=2054168 RepID=UPI0015E06459|nr:nuclease-related domain-containing protein [Bacillus sp. T33-2]